MKYLSKNRSDASDATYSFLSFLIFALSFVYPNPLHADKWVLSELQYALLPEHCKVQLSSAKFRGKSPFELKITNTRRDYWRKKVGKAWHHMHHYCRGLQLLTAAENTAMLRRSGGDRHSAYSGAESEIEYTIQQVDPSSPIWFEMNAAQARARVGLGKYDQAISQLLELQAQAPQRPETYVELAKTYKSAGEITSALGVLEKGLANVTTKGPILFYLAYYYYEIGDAARSSEFIARAEAAGMKMDSLRRRLKHKRPAAELGVPTTRRDIEAGTAQSK